MRIRFLAVCLACAILIAGCAGAKPAPQPPANQPPAQQTQQPAQAQAKQWSTPPAMQIDVNKQYTATLKTSMGDITIQLFPKESPKTVNNFVFLARQGFYDGVIFHRIIKTFMVQTGDPKGDGTGGPGYKFEDELPPKHSYEPGIVAMANSGPNTQGSQFFICTGTDCKGLDDPKYNKYTQFGKVTAGMDVVQAIAAVPVAANPLNGEPSKPTNPPTIKSVVVDEK